MAVVSLLAQVADSKASQAANAVSALMPSGVILPYGGNTAPTGWLECNGQEVSQTTYAELFAALGSTYDTQLNPVTGANWAAPSVGNFRVPDMRGMFMRGEGTPSGLDAVTVGGNQVQKTKPNSLSIGASTAAAQTLNTSSVSVSGAKNQMNGSTGNQSADHIHGIGSDGSHQHTIPSGNAIGVGTSVYERSNNANNVGSLPTANSAGAHSHGGGTGGISANHNHSWDFGAATFSASGSVSSLTMNSSTVTLGAISGDNETRPINRGVKYIVKV